MEKLLNEIQNNKFDETFIKLYSKENLTKQKERYIKSINDFKAYFGEGEVNLYSTPGRTEIGGNHTDHNLGIVLAASVDLDIIAIVRKNNSRKINIFSEGYGMLKEINLDNIEINEAEFETATSLIKGVLKGIENLNGEIGGFDAYITSDVLRGSGLSSSAAFEVMIGTILNHEYNNAKFTAVQIAQVGQFAENVYFNKPSGLMDQTACSVGSLMTIDFKDNKNPIVENVEFDLDKYNLALCVINSGGSHADLTADYAAIKNEMCSVANQFSKEVLREVDKDEFIKSIPNIRGKISDRAILRAIHYYMECDRAINLREFIENEDIDSFLKTIIESGHSSFEYNQNAYTQKDEKYQPISLALCLSQDFLQNKRGAFRLQGGGFAGTIQCFVDKNDLKEFKKVIENVFGENSCYVLNIRNYGSIKIEKEI